uniref:Dihydrolipoamide acetyltransferase component of pyruvate dehydrogenase complex n=1 Tax=Heterorhabditis bacteriophora TaxID=37862 RepID=A0A1I7XFJ6_HETBA
MLPKLQSSTFLVFQSVNTVEYTSVEVPAPQSGTIVELLVEDGSKVTAKQKLYKLQPGSSGESPKKLLLLLLRYLSKKNLKHLCRHFLLIRMWQIRVKMNRMRQRIATRLKDAQNTYAMLTTFNEIDMSNVLEMRSKYQKEFMKKHGVKLGLMSPFVRAAAYALTESPIVNAVIDDNEIVYRHFVGYINTTLKLILNYFFSFCWIQARDNKLAVEDMEGGTFTISNGGVFGSVFGTPIINPPQSAILGMHGIFDRPVAINGKSAVEDPRVIIMNL